MCCAILLLSASFFFLSFVALGNSADQSTQGIGYFLKLNMENDAYCLDGSGPLYYHVPGESSSKWYIHFESGGWCSSFQDCYDRSLSYLGSTLQDPPTMNIDVSYFSATLSSNPLMYNWNKVFIRYCDGGSFTGDSYAFYNNRKLFFKGKKIKEEVFRDLLEQRGMKMASDIVVSGCSAGGLASIIHGDYVSDLMGTETKVRIMSDSGFFLDFTGKGVDYSRLMKWVYFTMKSKGGLHPKCVEFYHQDAYKCIFAEYTLPFVQTPVFMLQSIYDEWQMDNVLGDRHPSLFNEFGKETMKRLKNSVFIFEKNSGFVDSCLHHCGDFWNTIYINSTTQSQAFNLWYNEQITIPFIQDQEYPCATCCY